MRHSKLIKFITAMAMLFAGAGALSAGVVVSVDMDTLTPGIQSTRTAIVNETFTIALVMTADASGVSSYGVSVNFDNLELSLNGAPASTQLPPAGFGFGSLGASSESQALGQVWSFGALTPASGPVSSTFTIGTISFRATAPVTDAQLDIRVGFFNVGADGMIDNSFNDVSASTVFIGGTVNVVPGIPKGSIPLNLTPIVTGLGAPNYAISPPGDTSRLFVVEQKGLVLVVQNGALVSTPALDIQGRIATSFNPASINDERGLLGLAFHPGFNSPASPGYRTLYTYSSEPIPSGVAPTFAAPNGATQIYEMVVTEWKSSAANPNAIDPTSRREVISFGKNASNNNGGTIAFGPDGYLYIGLGDGGNSNDVGASHIEPGGNAQNLSTPLGKILRIDPLSPALNPGSTDGMSGNGQYRIPTTSPFQGPGQVPEIYAYGFHNPYRFAFDRLNGQLIAADVGQSTVEEIDRVTIGSNYGWASKEGDFLFNRTIATGTVGTVGARSPESIGSWLIDPISGPSGTLEYFHDDGISIIGGFVYRGTSIPALYGKYVFGDLALHSSPVRADGRLFYADLATGQINEFLLPQSVSGYMPNGLTVHGFGEDANGELYVLATNSAANGTGGVLYSIDSPVTDRDLTSLTLSSGALTPAFSHGLASYTTSVSGATTSVTVTSVFANAGATAKVNGSSVLSGVASGAVALSVGANTLNVVVTAPDLSTKTYTVIVNRAGVQASYTTGVEVPVTAASYTATGNYVGFTLNYAPTVGTTLVVVKNTGLAFIGGTFENLTQGQEVDLTFSGTTYHFVVNYYGGTGNDLVLQWADVRPVAWGLGTSGQLGGNTTSTSNVPLPVDVAAIDGSALAGRTILAMSTGNSHSMALCSDGKVITWGANASGQLGNNTFTNSTIPVNVATEAGLQVLSGKTVVVVAAGANHCVALCSDGTLAAWGSNVRGELGDGTTTASAVPVAVDRTGVLNPALRTVVALSAGASYSLALCSNGDVVSWGANTVGQLGDNSLIDRVVPVLVDRTGVLATKTVIAVSAGASFAMVLCSDGTVAAWGFNFNGRLGNNTTSQSSVPVLVNTASGVSALFGKTVVAVSAGTSHTQALCSDGTLAAWGLNTGGRLGDGTTTESHVPILVTKTGTPLEGKVIVTASAASAHSLAICSDGTLAAWGTGGSGQLGNGGTSNSSVPVAVSTASLAVGERFLAASSREGSSHNVALIAMPPGSPLIVVQQPAGIALTDASATPVSFGNVGPASSNSLIFTILNSGSANLAVLPTDITFAGTNAADFNVTASPAASVYPTFSTTFTVRFTPAATGARIAAMHIASNVTGSMNPFDINLTGTGLTEQENWRQIYFGSPANSGPGADAADPTGGGQNNLFKYIAGLNPLDPNSRFLTAIAPVPDPAHPGQFFPDQMNVTFSPRFSDRTYVVKYRTDLATGAWLPLTGTTQGDNGNIRTVTDTGAVGVQKFYRIEITKQ